jgi:hypothetical protein
MESLPMATVLHFADPSNRQPGRGATVRLDGGEPCMISFASNGVWVRKSRHGLMGTTLYREKNHIKVATVALALWQEFPDNLLPAGFTEFKLIAFTNAVLHCATCAEVGTILNKAATRTDL